MPKKLTLSPQAQQAVKEAQAIAAIRTQFKVPLSDARRIYREQQTAEFRQQLGRNAAKVRREMQKRK
jgi:hypothetical protein